MGNSSSGEEASDESKSSKNRKKSSKKSNKKNAKKEGSEVQVANDKDNLENTPPVVSTVETPMGDEENGEERVVAPPQPSPVKKASKKAPRKEDCNPETGSIRSSCVSIPDLVDAVSHPDYDPALPFTDTETGKPLFKKNDPLLDDEESDEIDNLTKSDFKPVKCTQENDIDQISITNEDCL